EPYRGHLKNAWVARRDTRRQADCPPASLAHDLDLRSSAGVSDELGAGLDVALDRADRHGELLGDGLEAPAEGALVQAVDQLRAAHSGRVGGDAAPIPERPQAFRRAAPRQRLSRHGGIKEQCEARCKPARILAEEETSDARSDPVPPGGAETAPAPGGN